MTITMRFREITNKNTLKTDSDLLKEKVNKITDSIQAFLDLPNSELIERKDEFREESSKSLTELAEYVMNLNKHK